VIRAFKLRGLGSELRFECIGRSLAEDCNEGGPIATIDDVRRDLSEHLAALEREARKVYAELVLPNWMREHHGFGQTLHAYMMAVLAHVDLASTYWQDRRGSQTDRMEGFLRKYLLMEAEGAEVLVQMWRHDLMHQAKPRPIRIDNNKVYYWLLQWGEHLPREQHLTFSDSTQMRVLNVGMLYLLEDLRKGIQALLSDISASEKQNMCAIRVYERIHVSGRPT
jgi:hypothetical protein